MIFPVSERDVLDSAAGPSRRQGQQITIHVRLPNGPGYPHPGVSNFIDARSTHDRYRRGPGALPNLTAF